MNVTYFSNVVDSTYWNFEMRHTQRRKTSFLGAKTNNIAATNFNQICVEE